MKYKLAGNTIISFASTAAGQILPIDVGANGGLICQKGTFLCAQESVNPNITFSKKIITFTFRVDKRLR